MSKRNIGSIVVSVVVSIILSGILWNANLTRAQDQQSSLEMRVSNLESQMQSVNVFKLQYQAWSWGGYSAILYSTREKRVMFDGDTSFLHENVPFDYVCGVCRIGDHKSIALYDQNGNILDRADFFSRMKVGDFLIAWYTMDQNVGPSVSSVFYGKQWAKPFYWSEKTGLALAIIRIDGTVAQ